jgi:excisionase family DNA binding protein
LASLTPVERTFVRELQRLAKKGTSYFELLRVAVGPGSVALGGHVRITPERIAAPVYRVALDIATRAGVEQAILLHPTEQHALDAARREIGALLSVAQAAERIGISRAAVYQAISKGALETVQIGALTLVVLASAKAYRKARDKHAA